MARRTRHIPHQTKISVQDVRDYSTPEGASMANEEMRRLALKLDQLNEQVAPSPGAAVGRRPAPQAPDGGGGPGGSTTVTVPSLEVWNRSNADGPDNKVASVTVLDFDDQGATSEGIPVGFEVSQTATGHAVVRGWVAAEDATGYWFVRVNTESLGYRVNSGRNVNFIAGTNITITRNNADITISAPFDCGWTLYDDATSFVVGCDDNLELLPSGTMVSVLTPKPNGGRISLYNYLSVDTENDPYFDDVVFQQYPNKYADTGWDEVAFTVDHEWYWKSIPSHPLGGVGKTKAVIRGYVPTPGSATPTLQLQDDGVNVGPADTETINFDSNGQASTDVAVNFIVYDDGSSVRRLRGYVPNSGGYSFGIYADANAVHTVTSGTNVQLVSGTGVSLSQTSGVFTINRPFTVEDDNSAVGDNAVVTLNFDSNGQATTAVAVNFVVTDDGSGQRSVKAYIPSSAGSYQFNYSVNAGATESVDNGDTLDMSAVNGTIVISRTGLNTTYKSPLSVHDDTTPVGGDDTIAVNFDSNGETTTGQAVNFVVTDDGGGIRSIRGYVPASVGAYSWSASDGGTPDPIANGQTVTWTGGTNATVTYNATTNTFTFSSTYSYGWTVKVNGEAVGEPVDNGEDVDFRTEDDIAVKRTNRIVTIYRKSSEPGGGGGGDKQRVMMGYFDIDTTDEVGKPPWRYGHRKSYDIEHGWGLKNMHAYTLRLSDVALDPDGILTYYRSGLDLVNGEDAGDQEFQTFPMYSAVDGNTIRVWVTQSRQKPTAMRYWFVLRGI